MPKAKTTTKATAKAKTTAKNTAKEKTSTFKVKTKSGAPLALRTSPDKDSDLVMWIPDGSMISVSKLEEGSEFDGCKDWALATFDGKKGYCTASRLTKI